MRFALPAAASSFLRTDELDTIYFQVRGTRGEVLAGDRDLAEIFPEEGQAQHIVYFGDAEWHGDPVRVAYMFMFDPQAPRRVVVVGETLNKRQRLSNEIIAGIIIPQFFLFPVVALLAAFGLQRGTQPLERLRQRLLGRPGRSFAHRRARGAGGGGAADRGVQRRHGAALHHDARAGAIHR